MKSDADLSDRPISDHRALFWMIWPVTAAFACYFCMYAFRKPFTVAEFREGETWGMGFKTILIISQVAGYMTSKFLGIKIVSEMPPRRRALSILVLVLWAEVALVLFGCIPRPWSAVCLFLNGLPLGMVFGLVIGFLEGRQMTEFLAAGLCASFILADGVVKSAGKWLLNSGVSEVWMPAAAGALFLLPLMISAAMLAQIPPPNSSDILARNERHTMSRRERTSFLNRYGFGLLPIALMYLLVTIVRGVRADFAAEIWHGLGVDVEPRTFTTSEFWVALGVLIVNGSVVLIADNRSAFFTALSMYGLGILLLTIALLANSYGFLSPLLFMVLLGLGLYLPYVATHTTLFERLLALTKERGNVGFLLYVADAIGYLGYVAVIVVKGFQLVSFDILELLKVVCWLTVGLSAVCLTVSWQSFAQIKMDAVAPHVGQAAEAIV